MNSANGFILIGANEASVDRSLYSSEHSTSSKRPYVVVDYCDDQYGSYYAGSGYFFNSYWKYGVTYDDDGQRDDVPLYYDDGLQLRSNCYGYAFRLYFSEAFTDDMIVYRNGLSGAAEMDDFYAYKQVPGEFADKEEGLGIWDVGTNAPCVDILYDRFDLDNFYEDYIFDSTLSNETRMHYLVQLIQADANTLGYTVTEYTGTTIPNPAPDSDERLIAVVVNQPTGSSENSSFHFYMQHSDGSWSHKDGHAQPSNKCFNCKQVLEGLTIRANASEGPYANGFVKFFYINKNVEDTNHRNGMVNTTVRTIAP